MTDNGKNGKLNGKLSEQSSEDSNLRDRWLVKRDAAGRLQPGSVLNPGGKGAGRRTVDKAVRRAITGKDVEYLFNVYEASLNEIASRNAALEVYTKMLSNYVDVIDEMVQRRGELEADDLKAILEKFEQLPEKLRITLPGLQAAGLFNAILIKLLPSLKSIDAKVDWHETILKKVLSLRGTARLEYIAKGKDAIIGEIMDEEEDEDD